MSQYRKKTLEAGELRHHHGSSSSAAACGSWIEELRRAFNATEFTCAAYGCTTRAVLGAHVRRGFFSEVGKLVGLGGTAVVPCCDKHHPKRGDLSIRIKKTPAIIDKDAPVDWPTKPKKPAAPGKSKKDQTKSPSPTKTPKRAAAQKSTAQQQDKIKAPLTMDTQKVATAPKIPTKQQDKTKVPSPTGTQKEAAAAAPKASARQDGQVSSVRTQARGATRGTTKKTPPARAARQSKLS